MSPKSEEYPPVSEIVTAYDRRYFKLYVMWLDANAAGVEWLDTYSRIFENCEKKQQAVRISTLPSSSEASKMDDHDRIFAISLTSNRG